MNVIDLILGMELRLPWTACVTASTVTTYRASAARVKNTAFQ